MSSSDKHYDADAKHWTSLLFYFMSIPLIMWGERKVHSFFTACSHSQSMLCRHMLDLVRRHSTEEACLSLEDLPD